MIASTSSWGISSRVACAAVLVIFGTGEWNGGDVGVKFSAEEGGGRGSARHARVGTFQP